MNILVSTLYYLLFINSYAILHLYHNTPLWTKIPMPNPQTRPRCYFYFWPLYQSRLVPIERSCDTSHLHANLVPEKRLENCWLKPWKAAELPLQFAVISLVFDDAITWILLPTISSVFSNQSQPSEEPIYRWSVIEGASSPRDRGHYRHRWTQLDQKCLTQIFCRRQLKSNYRWSAWVFR